MTLLVAVAVDSAIIIGAALGACALLRRRAAALRHFVLAAAFTMVAFVPVFEAALPTWPVRTPAPSDIDEVASAVGERLPDEELVALSASAPGRVRRPLDWPSIAIVTWLAGSITTLALLAAGLLRIRRLRQRASPLRSTDVDQLLRHAARTVHVSRPVTLLCGDHLSAITWGITRPVVLLPSAAHRWSAERLRLVIVHELAHVSRGDWAWQLLAAVICGTQWFNPLLWTAGRLMRRESERAADDLVLAAGIAGSHYAGHLLALAREAGNARGHWAAATGIVPPSTLRERIQAMLNDTLDRQPPTTRTRAWIAAAALAAALPLAAATTAHEAPPPTVPRPAVALEEAAMMPTPTAPVSPAREVTDFDVAPTPRPSHVERRAAAPQPLPATLTGALFDQHNGLLPGAEIVLTSNTTGESHVATSDGEGAFTFPNLPPGTYTLVTSLRGFSRVRNVVTLADGATLRRHIVLPLGELQETITVAADGTVRVSQRLAREIPEPRLPAPCVGRVGGCVKPPTKTADVKPIYPSSLAAAGIGATVRLVGRVGIDGYLSDLRHDGSLGNDSSAFRPEFVSAAMEAVQQWEFNPTLLNGAPVEATINITVHFKPGAAR